MAKDLEELVTVAADLGADYFGLRVAVIRRDVRGERRGRRWFCDRESARAFLLARQTQQARREPQPTSV